MSQPQSPPPDQVLMQMVVGGKFISRALSEVARLGIADHLAGGSASAADLAAKTETNEDALYRVMRALSAVGVFEQLPDRHFANTPVSEFLRQEGKASLRAMVRWINTQPAWDAWGRLDHSVKTGKPAFDEVFGEQVFDYLTEKDPETGAIFNDAMTSFSALTGPAVAEAYDFSGIEKLVDVGGGHGAMLKAIVDKHANVKGIVFDLPNVVADVDLGSHADRITAEGGNFLESVPAGADAYIMKHIIHDWDDEHCTTILRLCREAMNEGGKVLIIEQVVSDAPESTFAKLLDLEMLVMTTGGRERTEEEFGALLPGAGLKLTRVIPTKSPVAVIEAVIG